MGRVMEAPKTALTDENLLVGTWKLESMVYEAIATGQRSSPFGNHPDGYIGYSRDSRMYAIGVMSESLKATRLGPHGRRECETPR
jgi:hypothetical protein